MDTQLNVVDLPAVQAMATGVDLDLTAVIAGLLFLVLYLVLKVLIFDPYVKIVEERDARIGGAQDDAIAMRAEAEQMLRTYEERLNEARSEAAALRDATRAEAEAHRSQVVEAARSRAGAQLASAREQLTGEMNQAEAQLDAQARELGSLIVSRVLGAKA